MFVVVKHSPRDGKDGVTKHTQGSVFSGGKVIYSRTDVGSGTLRSFIPPTCGILGNSHLISLSI